MGKRIRQVCRRKHRPEAPGPTGACTTSRLAAGDDVVIVGRNQEGLDRALHRLASSHASAVAVDAADPGAVARFMEGEGAFDHLVLAHSGGKGAGAFKELPLHDLRAGLEAKLMAQLTVWQAAISQVIGPREDQRRVPGSHRHALVERDAGGNQGGDLPADTGGPACPPGLT